MNQIPVRVYREKQQIHDYIICRTNRKHIRTTQKKIDKEV